MGGHCCCWGQSNLLDIVFGRRLEEKKLALGRESSQVDQPLCVQRDERYIYESCSTQEQSKENNGSFVKRSIFRWGTSRECPINFRWEHHTEKTQFRKSDEREEEMNKDTIFEQEKEQFVESITCSGELSYAFGVLIVEYLIEDIRQRWYPDQYIKWLSQEKTHEENSEETIKKQKQKQTVESLNELHRLDCKESYMTKLLKIKSSKDNLLSLVPESKDLLFKECLVFVKHHRRHRYFHRSNHSSISSTFSSSSSSSSNSNIPHFDPTQFVQDMVTDMLYDHRLLIVPPHPPLTGGEIVVVDEQKNRVVINSSRSREEWLLILFPKSYSCELTPFQSTDMGQVIFVIDVCLQHFHATNKQPIVPIKTH